MAGGKKTQSGPDRRVTQAPFNPMGEHTQNSSLAAAVTIARPNVVPPISKIIVQAIDQNIRYTLDGSDPTPTFGFRLTATNDPITLGIGPNTSLRFVEEAATAVLTYVFGN